MDIVQRVIGMQEPLFDQVITCPLCGEGTPTVGERFVVQQLNTNVRVVECPVCGLVYKEHVPSESLLKTIYSADYVHYTQTGEDDERSSEERISRMGRPQGRRHLDYGCGGGGLVRCALKRGWESYGADPFLPDSLVQGPEQGRFLKASAESGLITRLGAFDRISLWAVIEHLNHPLTTFQGLARCLKSQGTILFNAPHADSLVARRRGAHWGMALLLEHSTFWTAKSVRYVAQKAGLQVVGIKKCGTPYPFGVCAPSWQSFGLRKPSEVTSVTHGDDTAPRRNARASLLNRVSRLGQRLARGVVLGKVLRLGLNVLGTGDHIYVVLRKTSEP